METSVIVHLALSAFEKVTGGKADQMHKSKTNSKLKAVVTAIRLGVQNTTCHVKAFVLKSPVISTTASLLKFQMEDADANLLITSYIPEKLAATLRNYQLNYLDAAGNMYINQPGMVLLVQGQKKPALPAAEPIKLFQPAGLRVIYQLIGYPENTLQPSPLQLPLRELAKRAGVALGSVHNALADLEQLGFILRLTEKEKKLTNLPELKNRWVTAYSETLRPKLQVGTFRFLNDEDRKNWRKLTLKTNKTRWGGEPAAANYTSHIQPVRFTLYTAEKPEEIMRNYRLLPHPEGEIEVLNYPAGEMPDDDYNGQFNSVPPLLTYADLLTTTDPRNHETARLLYDDYLTYLD